MECALDILIIILYVVLGALTDITLFVDDDQVMIADTEDK